MTDNVIRLRSMQVGISDCGLIAVLKVLRHGDPDLEFRWPIADVRKIVETLVRCAAGEAISPPDKFVRRKDDIVLITDYRRDPVTGLSPDDALSLAELLAKSFKREIEERPQ